MCVVGGWGPMFGTKSQINPFFLNLHQSHPDCYCNKGKFIVPHKHEPGMEPKRLLDKRETAAARLRSCPALLSVLLPLLRLGDRCTACQNQDGVVGIEQPGGHRPLPSNQWLRHVDQVLRCRDWLPLCSALRPDLELGLHGRKLPNGRKVP